METESNSLLKPTTGKNNIGLCYSRVVINCRFLSFSHIFTDNIRPLLPFLHCFSEQQEKEFLKEIIEEMKDKTNTTTYITYMLTKAVVSI